MRAVILGRHVRAWELRGSHAVSRFECLPELRIFRRKASAHGLRVWGFPGWALRFGCGCVVLGLGNPTR